MYLTALRDADAEQKKQLLHYFSSTDFDFEEKVSAVKAIYESLGVKRKTELAINQYVNQAKELLKSISVKEEKKQSLYQLADILAHREK